jgi:hypothetical protein
MTKLKLREVRYLVKLTCKYQGQHFSFFLSFILSFLHLFTYVYIVWATSPLPTSPFWAEPVLPSCSDFVEEKT